MLSSFIAACTLWHHDSGIERSWTDWITQLVHSHGLCVRSGAENGGEEARVEVRSRALPVVQVTSKSATARSRCSVPAEDCSSFWSLCERDTRNDGKDRGDVRTTTRARESRSPSGHPHFERRHRLPESNASAQWNISIPRAWPRRFEAARARETEWPGDRNAFFDEMW
jgi:hypothetical protein